MNIIMLIKTTGLPYDGRLVKECESLKHIGYHPIIVVLEDDNKSKKGYILEDIFYKSIELKTRSLLPKQKALWLKTIEMYLKMLLFIFKHKDKNSLIWIHNIEMAGLLPILYLIKRATSIKKIVWDLHELPPDAFLHNRYLRNIYHSLLKLCDSIIVANCERKAYLIEYFGQHITNKIFIISNYVSKTFINRPKGVLPLNVLGWLKDEKYFVALGGASPNRNIESLLQAVLISNSKLIVVGSYHDSLTSNFYNEWGQEFNDNVLFTGLVYQNEIAKYLDNAIGSIILYKNNSANNWLCAPNRLYQSVARSIPIIVGCNPPMANLVCKYQFGVVLEGDGSSAKEIADGINNCINNYQFYKKNVQKYNEKHYWESQNIILSEIIN